MEKQDESRTRRDEQWRKYSKMDERAKDKLVRAPGENGGEQDAQKDLHPKMKGTRRRVRPRRGRKQEVERDRQELGVRRWRELVIGRENMEGYGSTGQSPQWAVVPMEEEEEE